MTWSDKDETFIWHPFSPLKGVESPLVIERAEGIYLHTEDGRKIIDAVSSWWVNLHGHANKYIAEKVSRQLTELEHVIYAGFTHKPSITLAERLLQVLPENQSKIFYSDNGSTAVEVAIKLALQFWVNKGVSTKKIVAIDGAYHGDTFGAMSVGERSIFTKPFFSFLFDVEFIPFPTANNYEEVTNQFRAIVEQKDVAAFIFEPLIQGAAGMRIYSQEVLDQLLAMSEANDVVTIADEVMTGFGRTGQLFASDHLLHKPDLICLSKGLTGGTMALGATACSDRIVNMFQSSDLERAFLHGHSYTANPLACTAANASLDLLLTDESKSSIARITHQNSTFVKKIKPFSSVKDARSIGTILAVEFSSSESSSYLSEMRNRIYPFFLERNILLRPLGNLLYVIPPYIITNKELDLIYSAIEEFLETLNS
ncbi:MAG: adenosylmethionine--8-amino-7-oxononanoate transaminase [Bacteroidota bacterium]